MTAADIGEQWLGIPGVEISGGGRLFVCWYAGGVKEPDPANRVYLVTSDDRGQTFTPPAVLADPPGMDRAYDPTLWLDPQGRLWLIYNQGNPETAEHGVWARLCPDPDAPQPMWQEPRRLGFAVPHSFRMNKPTVISTGEWVLPVTWSAQVTHDWFAAGTERQGVAISADRGETWRLYGEVEAPAWALEGMVIERCDQSLVLYLRAHWGQIWQSVSTDHGRTWGEATASGIANPGSRFFIGRLADGRWLLVNSPHPTQRTGIHAQASTDEGKTWGAPLVLDDRERVSYPDACQAADGTIYAVHDRDRHGAAEVILSTFPPDTLP